DTAQYTGTLAWKESNGTTAVSGNFAASTVYKAIVSLTAKTGYTFAGLGANSFTYSGATVTNAADSGVITIAFPATAAEGADTVVTLLSLTDQVTAPVRGAAPVTTGIDTAQYTGTLAWKESDGTTAVSGNFAASTVYKAVVTLTAKPGYTFTGLGANSFTYTGATVTNAADSGVATIAFPATTADTVVNILSLTDQVTAPVRGQTPVTTGITTAQYTGTLAWKESDGTTDVSGNFAASTVYKAIVSLTAKPGYTFTGLGANSFAYSGATVTNAADSGVITIAFPATAAEGADTVVNILSLTDQVTAPATGQSPVTTGIDTAQYTGTLAWKESDGTTAVSGNFAASTIYKAIVTLTAKTGYTFAGLGANSFAYSGATATNAADSGVVTIAFPATAAVVTILTLTDQVTAPVSGAAPVTTEIDTAQYTGTLAWKESNGTTAVSGTFAGGKVYKAVLTLTAKPGFTFAGLEADSFVYSYSGATATNAADSGVVTITFPALLCTVTYAVGAGTGTPPASQTVNYNSTIPFPGVGQMTAPAGKVFTGWQLTPLSGVLTIYKEGATYKVTGDLLFTAQWDDPLSTDWATVAITHASGIFGSTATISAIGWGNNKFVVGANSGKMAYSGDGHTWTAVGSSPFGTSVINDIAWGNGTFVAVGQSGKMAYSTDGETWTALGETSFEGSTINTIVYGNGAFVAVGGGTIRYSTDEGKTWTASDGGFAAASMAWGNNKFVAVGGGTTIKYSADGKIWTAVDGSFAVKTIAWGNNRFVAVGGSGGTVAYSTDGETWTAGGNSPFGTSDVYDIAGGTNMFVAVGVGMVAHSADGTSWQLYRINQFVNRSIHSIAYGNGKFVVGAQNARMAVYTE
ncbi:MAG: hypothetical protein LBF63_06955, partial [Treponema sp.]|nr:hypothetical protein [Treponema sp.]